MTKAPVRFEIAREGQPYIDIPVQAAPKPIRPIERSLALIFGRRLPQPIVVAFNRQPLKWAR